jgi:hypothetical protein
LPVADAEEADHEAVGVLTEVAVAATMNSCA